MFDRIVRAIKLDRTLYREVADDPAYMNEAVTIVVLVSLISSLGVLVGAGRSGPIAYVLQVLNSLLFGWVLWAVVAYFVGANFFGGRSSIPEMLRTLGYANAPRIVGLLGFIPCVGWLFSVAGWVLSIAAGVVAIRESMEFDTTKAVITAVIGLLVYIIVSIVVGLVWGVLTAPIQALGG